MTNLRQSRTRWAGVVRSFFPIAAGMMGVLLFAGCATWRTVNEDPFRDFAGSVEALRDGADKALDFSNDWAFERYVGELAEHSTAAEGQGAIENLLFLTKPGDPFYAQLRETPHYLKLRQFRERLWALNSGYVRYTQLLTDLAGSQLLAKGDFEKMAEDLNRNIEDAAGALELGPGDPRPRGLFSTLAMEVFRRYLESRRQEDLQRAIQENQPNVETFAVAGQRAVQLAALGLRHEYDLRFAALARVLTPRADSSARERESAARELVALDRQFLDQLAALQTLSQAYSLLPAAHRELSSAITQPDSFRTAVRALYDEARRLGRLYQRLAEKGSPSAAEAASSH